MSDSSAAVRATAMSSRDASSDARHSARSASPPRVPRWMYKLMCERGADLAPRPSAPSRSRAAPSDQHLGQPAPPPKHGAAPDRHACSLGQAVAMTVAMTTAEAVDIEPVPLPRPETDADVSSRDAAIRATDHRACADAPPPPRLHQAAPDRSSACRESFYGGGSGGGSGGEFSSAASSASSNASSSSAPTSASSFSAAGGGGGGSSSSGFDSRSASSVTSATSSAMTFSPVARGWNGPPPAESCRGGGDDPTVVVDTAPDRKLAPSSRLVRDHNEAEAETETTLCLSRLQLAPNVVAAVVHPPDESDTTPLASTSRLVPPSPPNSATTASRGVEGVCGGGGDAGSTTTTTTEPSLIAADDETLLAPENFATVSTDLYRSSFPRKEHFPFLSNLGLKSVMVLVQEPYPEENARFLEEEGIRLFQYGIPGNKEPFVSIPDDKVVAALTTILDKRNHPMLIHCNKGKHRTGCVVGCLRRIQSWSLTSIFDEYRRYSTPKSRAMDLQFIEAFGGLPDVWRLCNRDQLPPWPLLEPPPLPTPSDPPARPP
ncbi:hypothetical protein JCM3774_000643 [Rhodotorula dairenensis]